MTELHYLPSFHRDAEGIWLNIAEEDIAAADRVLDCIYDRCLILRDYPAAGPPRVDIAADCRHLVEGNYLILYRYSETRVTLVRVLHSRRQITGEMLGDRP